MLSAILTVNNGLKRSNKCKNFELPNAVINKIVTMESYNPKKAPELWWILGEANEAIASGPPFFTVIEGTPFLKMPHVVLFCGILHGFMNLKNSQKFSANRLNLCHIIWHIG